MEKEILEMREKIGCESASVWLLEEDESVSAYIFHGDKSNKLENMALKLGEGLCGCCIQNKEAIISNTPAEDSKWYKEADEHTGFVTKNIICLPIMFYEDCIGCVELLNKEGGFTQEDVNIANELIEQMVRTL